MCFSEEEWQAVPRDLHRHRPVHSHGGVSAHVSHHRSEGNELNDGECLGPMHSVAVVVWCGYSRVA